MITARKLAVGLAALLVATFAWAQQEAAPEDDVLQRYLLATERLEEAAAALPGDAAAAQQSLDRAFSALLTLARGSSGTLAESLDRVFERARTAVENRSATDLAVQTTVLRGGFQRLLYESALTAAVEGRPDLARSRLLQLARDVGLGAARLDQLEQLDQAGALRTVFEGGVAEQVAARLGALQEAGAPANTDAAYRELSRAYADYLLVQDSGRIDPGTDERFVQAAQALVDGDSGTYLAELGALTGDLTALRDAADAGTPPEQPAGEGEGAVAELPSEPAQDETAPDRTAPETTPEEGEPADTETESADEAAANADGEAAAAEPVPDDLDLEALRDRIASELEAEREAQALADLRDEMAALGVPEAQREPLAERLHDGDVTSITGLEEELAAMASRLEARALRGDTVGARALLDEFRRRYATVAGPVIGAAQPQADAELRALLIQLDETPAVRTSDAALLSSELAALAERLRGGTTATAHQLARGAGGLWTGWIRPAVMIAIALLALLPLRLLGLAFGGGNPNWRRVGFALFLLLLPIFVEGVISAAALLAAPLGVPALAGWTVASVFASDLTQMVWAAAMLLAVLFAAGGFYGICVQFGVLGRRRTREPARSQVKTRDDTLVDWDDEF
jgi:hypothetical protein